MDRSRIREVIDQDRIQAREVTIIGAGGAAGLANNLVRSGVCRLNLVDPDIVTPTNIARQAHDTEFLGVPKVDALAEMLRRTDPDVSVRPFVADITRMSDDEIDTAFGASNLFIHATDRFQAAARGNEISLRLGVDSLWVGLYPRGLAGEIVWWHRAIDPCWRCLCQKRYAAHAQAAVEGRSLDPSSDGCTIFDITLLDSIAGAIAVGLLTRGADNRFGRLIEQLGNRNFLQVQLDPSWSFGGRNPVRDHLGVAADCPGYFAWNTAVRSDPDAGLLPCPDCERFREHQFLVGVDGRRLRLRPFSRELPERGGHG